jgi:hypothetical protein
MKVKPANTLAKTAQLVADTMMFACLTKVDTVNRIVHGRAVQEVPDASGEIFDYKSSKPYFEKWVADTREATAGKSLGNIRAMHGNVAAGKAVEVTFHDDECAIDISAKVVDDNEWAKVLEGVYTGFSIGGSYVGKKRKDGDLMRYTAAPTEISLVDKPCIPSALFYDVVKSKGYTVVGADGAETHADFKLEAEPVAKVVAADPAAEDAEVEIEGTAEEVKAFGKMLADAGLTLGKASTMVATQLKIDAPKRFAAAWYFVNTAKAAELYADDAYKALRDEVAKAFEERFGAKPEDTTAEKALAELSSDAVLAKSFYTVASAADMLRALSFFMSDMEYWESADAVPTGTAGKVMTCVQAMGAVIGDLIAHEASNTEKAVPAELVKLAEALIKGSDDKKAVKRVQRAHDLLVESGAKCAPAEKVELEGDLAKVATLTADLAKLRSDLEAFKAQPRPAKATFRVVSKSDDTLPGQPGSVEDLIKNTVPITDRQGNIDVAATAIKVLHAASNPAPQSA